MSENVFELTVRVKVNVSDDTKPLSYDRVLQHLVKNLKLSVDNSAISPTARVEFALVDFNTLKLRNEDEDDEFENPEDDEVDDENEYDEEEDDIEVEVVIENDDDENDDEEEIPIGTEVVISRLENGEEINYVGTLDSYEGDSAIVKFQDGRTVSFNRTEIHVYEDGWRNFFNE